MEQSDAAREVQDIKRIMERAQQRSDRTPIWVGLGLIALAVVMVGLLPFLAPVVGVGLLIGGAVAYRRSMDSLSKGIAAAAMGIGILLILFIAVALLGLMAVSSGVEALEPIDVPVQPMQPLP